MKQNAKFEKTINSSIYEVKLLITEALRYVDTLGDYSDEKRANVRLIISELLVNALYHGNKNINIKKIKLTIQPAKRDHILIQVEDEGRGLNTKILRAKKNLTRKARPALDESGRGLLLINQLSGNIFTKREGKRVCTKINMKDREAT
jgi:anti-sigma regulatory factor (Ser/Thr protein kinase)